MCQCVFVGFFSSSFISIIRIYVQAVLVKYSMHKGVTDGVQHINLAKQLDTKYICVTRRKKKIGIMQ